MLEWKENLSDEEWDNLVSSMKGHPLQSATWGNAKKITEGVEDIRWAAFKNSIPIYLARFEVRYFLKILKIAWIPRGPIFFDQNSESVFEKEFLSRLKHRKFFLCCAAPWQKVKEGDESKLDFLTMWVDLKLGKERLWQNLSKQFRYDVKRAKRLGVTVEKSKAPEDIFLFYEIHKKLSANKKFSSSVSYDLMMNILKNGSSKSEPYLFIARHEGKFCGAAFIFIFGESAHYMWGAVDRVASHLSIGEAIQWSVIEWAIEKKCTKYDLEGITHKKNSGVDHFKKKIGGELISNPCIQIRSFGMAGKLGVYLLKLYLYVSPSINEFKKNFFFHCLYLSVQSIKTAFAFRK